MKAQINILYLLLTIAIAFLLASGVFLFFKIFRSNAVESSASIALDRIAQQIEDTLLSIKRISESEEVHSLNITLKIPKRIGDQKYVVQGQGNQIELRTVGDPSIVKVYSVAYWPDVNIKGVTDSGTGKLTFRALNSTFIHIQ